MGQTEGEVPFAFRRFRDVAQFRLRRTYEDGEDTDHAKRIGGISGNWSGIWHRKKLMSHRIVFREEELRESKELIELWTIDCPRESLAPR
jgi:hypothetical protein